MTNFNKNEYDSTKKMLNLLREFKNDVKPRYKNLFESEEIDAIDDASVKINTDSEEDLELSDEDKKALNQVTDNFKTQVNRIVEFNPGFTITDNQIRLDGSLLDGSLGFVLIAGTDAGLYINADMFLISDNDEAVDTINKLKEFYKTYRDTIEPIIDNRNNNL
jgi:hypothetical protein